MNYVVTVIRQDDRHAVAAARGHELMLNVKKGDGAAGFNAAETLLAELRTHQYQDADEAAYNRLLQQFHSRPSVKTYQAAEEALYDLVQAVEAVISEAAGIDFAANAKRSCCGG